jgi:biotin carboxyl carrier protein
LPADSHPHEPPLFADKAAINVKASRSGVIAAILVEIDEPIMEFMPMFELQ